MLSRTFCKSFSSLAFLTLAVHGLHADMNDFQLSEMTEDTTTYERTVLVTNSVGAVTQGTNRFTVLDYGMQHFQNGRWEPSRDSVESYPDGAIATNGAYATIFSADLNAEAVFDIRTPEGYRIRGGVRAIQLTDIRTGKSVLLGSVKGSVRGEIVPPNMVLYRSAFDGVEADVLYIWAHNAFSQNVIAKGKFGALPAEWDPAATRLEVVTELVETPDISILKQGRLVQAGVEFSDHGLLSFGKMLAIPGMAFPLPGGTNWDLTGSAAHAENSVPVVKQLYQSPDGRTIIIESIEWNEVASHSKGFAVAPKPSQPGFEIAKGRFWPRSQFGRGVRAPMQVASLPVSLDGYLVDLELLSGSTTSMTFNGATTYYIPSSYWVHSSSTFMDGTVIKLGPSGSLTVSGSVISPAYGIATITARDDDTVGERVVNAGSPPYTSDGVVSASGDYAGNALNSYYVANNTVFQRFRIRYAEHGIHDYSPYNTDTVKFCRLEDANFGAYAYYTTITFLNNEVCRTYPAYAGTGGMVYETGTTTDCGPVFRTWMSSGLQSGDTIDGQSVLSPPDNMGAIGLDHYVELINGAIVIFNRTNGSRIAQMGFDNFFRITNSGISYPRPPSQMNDPRILYDHRSGRCIACAMENPSVPSNQVIVAVSRGSDPVGNPNSDWRNLQWDRHLITLWEQNGPSLDFPTLGTDDNGVYISVDLANTTLSSIAAVAKGSLLGSPSTLNATYIRNIAQGTIQPALNFDAVPSNGPAWFVSHRTKYFNSDLRDVIYATLTWNAGTPTLSSWTTLSTAAFGSVVTSIPSKGTSAVSLIQGFPMRFSATAIRNSQLWTCRTIGVNSTGGVTGADRNACEWFRLTLTGTTATSSETGRIYDTASSNPTHYFYPSMMVNSQGAAFMAFAGAGLNAYYGAYAVGRVSTDPAGVMSGIKVLQLGEAAYDGSRWGDYTQTTLDPRNGLSIWTIQQYARTPSSNWRTWIDETVPLRH